MSGALGYARSRLMTKSSQCEFETYIYIFFFYSPLRDCVVKSVATDATSYTVRIIYLYIFRFVIHTVAISEELRYEQEPDYYCCEQSV